MTTTGHLTSADARRNADACRAEVIRALALAEMHNLFGRSLACALYLGQMGNHERMAEFWERKARELS